MPDLRSWHPLPAAPHHDIPTLLVSTSFGQSSYSVHVTDLASVWAETLDRRAICMRAFREDTTIDPSEDAEQMGIFLGKLRAAFDAASPEHAETSLSLSQATPTAADEGRGGSTSGGSSQGSSRGDSGDDLLLRITCILPGNLKPLRWPLHLRKLPASAIATELVLPLVQAQHARAREIDALVAMLRDKDAVITRLVDKLDTMSTGLEHIFAQLAGRRKATRATADGRVRGLAPFDESAFRAKARSAGEGGEEDDEARKQPRDVAALVDDVFGGAGLAFHTDLEVCDSPGLDGWWKKLGTGPGVALARRETGTAGANAKAEDVTSLAPAAAATTPTKKNPVKGEDDFEVLQTTPTSAQRRSGGGRREALAAARRKVAAALPDDESTEDDDDGGSREGDKEEKTAAHTPSRAPASPHHHATPSRSSPSGPAPPAAAAKSGRLGVVGGKEQQKKDAEPAPPPSPAPVSLRQKPVKTSRADAVMDDAGSETASDVEPEEAPSPPPPPRSLAPSQPKKAGGLGHIGGGKRGKAAATTPEPAPTSLPDTGEGAEAGGEAQTSPAKPPTAAAKGRLGHIGKKPPAAEASTAESSQKASAAAAGKKHAGDEDGGGGEGEGGGSAVKGETEEQRADRRREELQRELAQKAAAPAKKKRKF